MSRSGFTPRKIASLMRDLEVVSKRSAPPSGEPSVFSYIVSAFVLSVFVFSVSSANSVPYWASWIGVFAIFAVALSLYRQQIDEWEAGLKQLLSCVSEKAHQHGRTLAIKRRQILRANDYGAIEPKRLLAWASEIENFLGSVDLPRLSDYQGKVQEIYDLVDSIALSYQGDLTHDVGDMTPTDYEVLCADILKKFGWDTEVTKAQGDQGVDVVAEKSGKRAVLQCKLYSRPVGNKAVQEVVAGRLHYGADVAAVVSNQPFTPSARELAESSNVILLHHEELDRL